MTKDFTYAQRFGKNKDHGGAKVQHLYITNYDALPETPPEASTVPPMIDQTANVPLSASQIRFLMDMMMGCPWADQ